MAYLWALDLAALAVLSGSVTYSPGKASNNIQLRHSLEAIKLLAQALTVDLRIVFLPDNLVAPRWNVAPVSAGKMAIMVVEGPS